MELDWMSPFSSLADTGWLLAITLAVVWSLVWKGIALWQAGKNAHLGWFIALYILNTLGILEIVYLIAFNRVAPRPQKDPRQW